MIFYGFCADSLGGFASLYGVSEFGSFAFSQRDVVDVGVDFAGVYMCGV
jgi:hypothetical protein